MWRIVAVVLVVLLGGSIDPDQFECEEAVAHMKDCCGSLPAVHCGEACEDVQLSLATSTCLAKASCDALRRSGACDNPTGVECD